MTNIEHKSAIIDYIDKNCVIDSGGVQQVWHYLLAMVTFKCRYLLITCQLLVI